MISWSNRGQGSCPNCATVYFNRSKPVECSNCGYHLGGSAAAKMPKLSCPVADHIHGGLYSLRTSTRDDRCFVYKECDNWICLHSKCKDIRAMYVSSNQTDEFSCQHLKHVAESVEASGIFPLTEDKISSYPCDSATKEMLKKVVVPAGHQAVYKVSDRTFVVYCQPSATNTLGFCHVKAEDGKNGKYHKCCCKGFLAKGKQEKSRAICDHLHVLFCCTELHNTVYSSTTVLSTSAASPSSESTSSLSEDPQHAVSTSPAAPFSSESISSLSEDPQQPVSRASTLQLYANEKLPYRYSTQFLNLVSRKDAATHLSCSGQGWPSIFEVADASCRLCGNPLGQSKVHSGSRGGSVLYSNLNPFKKVVVRVKECSLSLCKAMHRVFPTEKG